MSEPSLGCPMNRRRWMAVVSSPPWLDSTNMVTELIFWNFTYFKGTSESCLMSFSVNSSSCVAGAESTDWKSMWGLLTKSFIPLGAVPSAVATKLRECNFTGWLNGIYNRSCSSQSLSKYSAVFAVNTFCHVWSLVSFKHTACCLSIYCRRSLWPGGIDLIGSFSSTVAIAKCFFICASTFAIFAPVIRSTLAPFLIKTKVGKAVTPAAAASSLCSSTSIF